MDKVKNKIIIWSIDGFNTLALIRQAGIAGNDVFFVVKGSVNFAAKSKYCNGYIETSTVEEGYDYLMKHYREEECKPIILICSEDVLIFADEHKDELEQFFILPVCGQKGDTSKFIDKNTMTQLAAELGMVCPISKEFRWDSDISDVEYPCLLKPSHEKPGHYNEFKFKICKTEKQLRRALKLVRHDSEFILQQYIPIKNELLVYGCRMWDGKTVIAGTSVKDRSNDTGASSHGYLTCEVPECIDVEKIKAFVDKIDYHGLFSVEYGLHNNQAYFFEINLRNDGTSHFFYQAGANLPLAYIYNCAGMEYDHVSTKVAEKTWYIDELYDYENVLLGKMSRKKWLQEREQAKALKYYDENDMVPYNIAKKMVAKQTIQDIILKRFRLYIVFILDKLGLRK